MRILGVDPGQRRVGLALSDPSGTLAVPLECLDGRDRDRVLAQVARLARAEQVEAIVVGLARNMDGSLGPAAQAGQEFARILERKTGLPVHLEDERLSTHEALEKLREAGVPARQAREKVDSAAAALILQAFLDRGK